MLAFKKTSKLLSCTLAIVLLLIAGCGQQGPKLGYVQGKVTLDEEPLPNAKVVFSPVEGGATSIGRTNEEGTYELVYSKDRKGALVGKHRISISTGSVLASQDPENPGEPEVTSEKVPAKYNVNSELTREVTSGENTIDFDLESGGETVQPQTGEEANGASQPLPQP